MIIPNKNSLIKDINLILMRPYTITFKICFNNNYNASI